MSKLIEYIKTAFWILLFLQIAPPIIKNVSKNLFDTIEPKNKVGLIVISEIITSSTKISSQLKKFFKDPEIKAILLKIDSPGGAAGSTEAINQEIIRLKKEYPKPVIAYSENLCASGAYYIAAATDRIITTSSALVGSIGAKLNTQFKVQDLLARYDIKTHSVASGSYKNALDICVPMTEEQQAMLQTLTDSSYEQFTLDISKYRHLNLSQKSVWADGKIFTGNDALKLKLIDEIGNLSTAIHYIKQQILHADREIELIKCAGASRLEKLLYPDHDEDESVQESFTQVICSELFSWLSRQGVQHSAF